MKKLTKKKRRKIIAWTVVLELILAALVVYGVYSGALKNSLVEGTVIVMLLLIPVLLVTLLVAVMAGSRTKKTVVVQAPATPGEETPAEDDGTGRFCMLTRIDENRNRYGHDVYNRTVTLEKFCEDFRNYAASKLKLYYDIDDIRRFIAGMAVSKILILQGMSGTGKTSLAHAFGEFVDNRSTVIPVQPMWKERTDLIGYYNEFTKRFNETLLLEKMYEANYNQDMYVTVLDEMNIARVEYCPCWSCPTPRSGI